MVGDIKTLVESDLIDNLSPRAEGDYSWVKPGITSWTWLSEGQSGQNNEKIIRDYIDLAAEMNWSYVLLDDGWQPGNYSAGYSGYYPWFDGVMKYAEEKGVGILVWARWQDLDTETKLKRIDDWAKKGIKGIKADFFDSEEQARLEVIKRIYEKCDENKLILNIHGGNKPAGDRSSYPFVINREYVMGQEYGGIYSSNSTVWAYTRGVVGPSDITPKLTATGNLTSAQQIALNVVFESGMPCMADDSEVYRNSSIKSYFRNLPSKWDDLRFLEGGVGSYTVLARKSGTEWWVGAVNNQSKRSVEVQLSELLGDGSYYAVIYYDGATRNEVLTRTEKVTKDSILKVNMAAGGGFVIRIFGEDELNAVESIRSTDEYLQVKEGSIAASHFDILPANAQLSDLTYAIADPTIASVGAGGTVTGLKPGITTLTATDGSGKVQGAWRCVSSVPAGIF